VESPYIMKQRKELMNRKHLVNQDARSRS